MTEYYTIARRQFRRGWTTYRRRGPKIPPWLLPCWLVRTINRRLPVGWCLDYWVVGDDVQEYTIDDSVAARGVW